MSQHTTYLKDYQAPQFTIEDVQLDVDLHDDVTVVRAKLSISGTGKQPLVLDGHKLDLKSVQINGKLTTDYQCDEQHLTIPKVPAHFELETVVHIKPQDNTALCGLYKSGNMFCTQCEAHGFRSITYYLDRPDVMSKFVVTIHADKRAYPVLLANGNLIDQGSESATRHFATWEDPFKKPCYLFALVAGDLVALEDHFVTMSGRLVTLKLFIERENIDQSAYAIAALKKAMRWDEEKYGREYDLDIYMIVAVNSFNMGAMENKGLNIFNSKYILVSPATATDYDFEGVDMVVGHEYFHNWSGNRVTCRDWFQLSLKEGFTVFREQQFTQYVTRSPVARIENAQGIMTRQFSEDAGPLAHPVRPDSYVEINNFYTATVYDKGAEVIRMLHTILGDKLFRAGTDLYFAKFDGQAVTTDDFVTAMEQASGLDLRQFRLWYSQAGTPLVTVQEDYAADAKQYTLTLTQHIPDTPGQTHKKPMYIPIRLGLLDSAGNDIPIANSVLALTEAEQSFEFKNIQQKPILSILRDFSAPVKLEHQMSTSTLAFLFAHDQDNFNRWYAGQQLYIAALFDQEQFPILLDSFKQILIDTELNLSLRAELLLLPSFTQLVAAQQPADPELISKARRQMTQKLSKTLHKEILDQYKMHIDNGVYKFTAADVAARGMKNLMLWYLLRNPNAELIALAVKQYQHANNMTDTVAALSALVDIECKETNELFADFYAKWSAYPLVVNKWLALQAHADVPDCLVNVKRLMQHPAFDLKNPNKVYSLIGGFCSGNPAQFHAADGSGYQFLADTIIDLNKINPQVAARMLTPLTEWRKFIPNRQQLMRAQLQRISDQQNLSPDVYEIVSKSLCE